MENKRPLHVGLTGSIGMGKSETAKMFARLGVPVYDADAAVHRLYQKGGGAVVAVEAAFPGTVRDGAVDRVELSKHVTGNPEATQKLTGIVYPLMAGERRKFLDEAEAAQAELVVFDIPLLFETKGEAAMDAVVVVSAPSHIQRARVLARPGMTEEKFAYLHSRQMPDEEKRAKAHFVVVTDQGLAHAFDQVKMIVDALEGAPQNRAIGLMRQVVLDTETTGFEPADGHRVVEIGCVELFDHLPTGRTYRCYLNPERLVPIETTRIHGLTDEFLADKPRFVEVVEEFLEFIGDAALVIHNASFDLKFVNSELHRVGKPPIPHGRAIDTIEIAKSKIPGARYSLDELCKRFAIDLSARTKHGALLDAELTAQVYLELVGGRQRKLSLDPVEAAVVAGAVAMRAARARPEPLAPRLTPDEAAAHLAFVEKELGKEPVWALVAA